MLNVLGRIRLFYGLTPAPVAGIGAFDAGKDGIGATVGVGLYRYDGGGQTWNLVTGKSVSSSGST